MIHENNLMTVNQFEGTAYKSSQAAELTLNAVILRAEIARSYEEFLKIFDKFYADDVPRQRQRDTFPMEDRLHWRRRETVHFEVVRDSGIGGVQGCVRTPLRS